MLNVDIAVPDQQIFDYLMIVVKEDSQLRNEVIDILSNEKKHRKTKLEALLQHSKFQHAPIGLQKIFVFFLDDIFAKEVAMYLRKI